MIYYTAVAIVAIPNRDVTLSFLCQYCSLHFVRYLLEELIFVAQATGDQTIPYTFQLMDIEEKSQSQTESDVQQ